MTYHKIKPAFQNLLIRVTALDMKESNIIRPDQSDPTGGAKYPYGEVVDIGEDVEHFTFGDKVLFLANNAVAFEEPSKAGGVLWMIPETVVMGKYEEEKV